MIARTVMDAPDAPKSLNHFRQVALKAVRPGCDLRRVYLPAWLASMSDAAKSAGQAFNRTRETQTQRQDAILNTRLMQVLKSLNGRAFALLPVVFLPCCTVQRPDTSEKVISVLLKIGEQQRADDQSYVERSLGTSFRPPIAGTDIRQATDTFELGQASYLINREDNKANVQFVRSSDKPCIKVNELSQRLAAQFDPWPYNSPYRREWLISQHDNKYSVFAIQPDGLRSCIFVIQLYQFEKKGK